MKRKTPAKAGGLKRLYLLITVNNALTFFFYSFAIYASVVFPISHLDAKGDSLHALSLAPGVQFAFLMMTLIFGSVCVLNICSAVFLLRLMRNCRRRSSLGK